MPLTSESDKVLIGAMPKTLFRVEEAAEVLAVSRWTIYRWVEEGRLRGTKIGKGSLRIFRESVVGLIEGNERDVSRIFVRAEHS